jgi:D-alanyl-D-alanine carboxypeptidase/D-alanyl-D-alanine-endopeptidase (penicillin-binding protein 4)
VIGDESAFDAFRGVPPPATALTSEVGPAERAAFNHGGTGKRRPYFQRSPAQFAAQASTRRSSAGRRGRRHGPRRLDAPG